MPASRLAPLSVVPHVGGALAAGAPLSGCPSLATPHYLIALVAADSEVPVIFLTLTPLPEALIRAGALLRQTMARAAIERLYLSSFIFRSAARRARLL